MPRGPAVSHAIIRVCRGLNIRRNVGLWRQGVPGCVLIIVHRLLHDSNWPCLNTKQRVQSKILIPRVEKDRAAGHRARRLFRPSVLALFGSQPAPRRQGVEVRIVELFARRLGQSVGEIFFFRRPSEGGGFEDRLRLKKILMRGRSMGELRTA